MDVTYDDNIEDKQISETLSIQMQPFFGPDNKYGSCPCCGAAIIIKNEEMTTSCPNCKVLLAIE